MFFENVVIDLAGGTRAVYFMARCRYHDLHSKGKVYNYVQLNLSAIYVLRIAA